MDVGDRGVARQVGPYGCVEGTMAKKCTTNSKLFTPGPTKIPGGVLSAVGKQVLHHRTPQFSEKVRHVQDEIGRLLTTRNASVRRSRISAARQAQGKSLPKLGCSSGTSNRMYPNPPQMEQ